ncbi:MAG: DUF4276 family protein [Candidatus Binatia bacterium]|nr:DUF4276 family protein [Candidatus Binatia bacterium]
MSFALATIVEGHAEVESVPLLLRRIFAQLGVSDVQVARPFRVKRNRIVKPGELERAISQTIRDRAEVGGIMVLIDSDDDCPAELGVQLLNRAKEATQMPVSIVLAHREFECWFLGSKESLQGVNGIVENATAPPNPEGIRGAKEHLTQNMIRGRRYLAVDDQVTFAEKFDLNLARQRCSSFDKCYRDVERLLNTMGTATQ